MNATGLRAEDVESRMRVGSTTITGNAVGISIDASASGVASYGDNRLAGNGTNGAFTSKFPQQ